jgi:hypothetical protein
MTTATQNRQEGPATFETVCAALQETDRKIDRLIEESNRRQAEADRKQQEAAEQRQKEAEQRRKEEEQSRKEMDRQMKASEKRLNKQFGKLGNRFGDMVECLVLPNLRARFNDLGYAFKEAAEGQKIEDDEHGIFIEIDAYLEDNECAIAVETKVKPSQGDVDFHIKRMEKLRAYADLNAITRRYYGGMAGVVLSKEIKAYILAHGLYAIEPSGETFNITAPEGPGRARKW